MCATAAKLKSNKHCCIMATTEFLQKEEEKFKKAAHLNDIESKNDPESDPFKSKYEARKIWLELRKSVDEFAGERQNDKSWLVLKAALDLKLGTNYTETDELGSGEDHLNKVLNGLENIQLQPEACVVVLQALNTLGILWTGRSKPQKAKEFLMKAKDLYNKYKQEVDGEPYTIEELLEVTNEDIGEKSTKRSEKFESTYTHSLYYLAQVCTQLGDTDTGAAYCHETLQRQLESKKYDPWDWAMNCATLSQFYMTSDDFTLSRHCMASAQKILEEYGEQPKSLSVQPIQDEDNSSLMEREKLPKSWADLFRCWIKYGLALMEHSRDYLFASLDNDENGEERRENTTGVQGKEDIETKNKKKLFELELTPYEELIRSERVLDFEDAKKVFLQVQKWINSAKEFYTLDGHCTDHVEIVQDHSRLFKVLAFFEKHLDRQCRMHKRRVDMLKSLIQEINPQFYLLIYRQLQYELADTLSAMVDNKIAIIEELEQPPNQHAVKKINSLCQQAIDQYQAYVDTLNDSKTKAPPLKYADEDERPVLVAHFCMGRLCTKFLVFDLQGRLANMKKSIDHYNFLVDYCRRNPSASAKVATEKELCEEMVTLLPAKMDKLRNEFN